MDSYIFWSYVKPEFGQEDHSVSPASVDYKMAPITPPHQVISSMVSGEVLQIDYYANGDIADDGTETYDTLIVRVNFEWVRSTSGRLLKRLVSRRWTVWGSTDENPVFGPEVKTGTKVYNETKADKADERRRSNIIAALRAQSSAFNATLQYQKMSKILAVDRAAYIDSGTVEFVDAITDYVDPDNHPWLEIQVPGAPTGYLVRDAIKAQLQAGVVTA